MESPQFALATKQRRLVLGVLLTAFFVILPLLAMGQDTVSRDSEAEGGGAPKTKPGGAPVFGSLYFSGIDGVKKDTWEDGGRVGDHRSYITGPHGGGGKLIRNFAIWSFDDLPPSLGEEGPVRIQYTFSTFHLAKVNDSGKIWCRFTFVDGGKDIQQIDAIRQEVQRKTEKFMTVKFAKTDREKFAVDLMKEYGFYSASQPVSAPHTETFVLPGELFKKLREVHKQSRQQGKKEPILKILVEVRSPSQMVGVSARDLCLQQAETPSVKR